MAATYGLPNVGASARNGHAADPMARLLDEAARRMAEVLLQQASRDLNGGLLLVVPMSGVPKLAIGIQDVPEALGVGMSTVKKLTSKRQPREKRLPTFKIGNRRLVRLSDLAALMERGVEEEHEA